MFLQLLQRNAEFSPDETAIEYGDESVSHAALLGLAEQYARGFVSLGVSPGDRVALLLENSPDYIACFFAVAACRAVNVPLNPEFKEDEVLYFVSDAAVRCIVVDAKRAELAKRVAAQAPQDVQVIVRGDTQNIADVLALTELGSEGQAKLPASCLDDDVIYIYSSGTTGRPKCAPRTVVQYWWEMNEVAEGVALTRADRIFCVLPLFHNFGSVHCMLVAAGTGARLVMLKNANPFALRRAEAIRLLRDRDVSIFPGVPFMFDSLVNTTKSVDLSHIRVCYSASAALSEQTVIAFRERFGVQIRDHYGCTEVGAMTINMDPDPDEFRDSVGKPFPGVRINILGDDGEVLPRGETGEIAVGSRAMTRGYLGLDDTNARVFRDGYFFTGDLGRLDEEGRLYLLGRKKFVIDVVGQKVSPIEVEDVLGQHDGIADCVVMGIPNPHGHGQVVAAWVVCDAPLSRDAIVDFCRARLANFKVPQLISYVREVPRNALGKVVRQLDVIESNVVDAEEVESLGETA